MDIAEIVEHAFHEYNTIIATGALNHGVPPYVSPFKAFEQNLLVNIPPIVHKCSVPNEEHGSHEDLPRIKSYPNGIETSLLRDEDDSYEVFHDTQSEEEFGYDA